VNFGSAALFTTAASMIDHRLINNRAARNKWLINLAARTTPLVSSSRERQSATQQQADASAAIFITRAPPPPPPVSLLLSAGRSAAAAAAAAARSTGVYFLEVVGAATISTLGAQLIIAAISMWGREAV